MREVKFTVIGKSQPGGSKTAYPYRKKDGSLGVRVTDANPKGKAWASVIKAEALNILPQEFSLWDGPISIEMFFYIQRPKFHYGSGKHTYNMLKQSSPLYPTGKPDVLKLARCVEDALTGVLWVDDAQIIDERIIKRYCDIWESPSLTVVARLIEE